MMTSVRASLHVKLWWAAACAALIVVVAALVISAPGLAREQNANSPQEAVVAPNENLVVENVPPIPQSLADQADRYTNFRSAFFASWHPSKREMLVATRFADTFQIHQVKMQEGRAPSSLFTLTMCAARSTRHRAAIFSSSARILAAANSTSSIVMTRRPAR